MLTSLYKKIKISQVILFIILITYCSIAIILIGNTILSSFKTKEDLVHNTVGFPKKFVLTNYHELIIEKNFIIYLLNSCILCTVSILCILFISSLTAYGLSRYKFKGSRLLESYFLIGLMFPIQLGILPIFIILRNIGLINNLLGLIILYTANLSLPVFILSKFFKTLPQALHESAKIDGAGEFTIYFRIMMPISRTVLVTVSILYSITIWNDFFMPLVLLTRDRVKTLPLGIAKYLTQFLANWHLIFSAASIGLVPIILFFVLFSKNLISGITTGALKE